jgi:hypothetical protein
MFTIATYTIINQSIFLLRLLGEQASKLCVHSYIACIGTPHPPTIPTTHSLTHSLNHSISHSVTQSLTHSLTHSSLRALALVLPLLCEQRRRGGGGGGGGGGRGLLVQRRGDLVAEVDLGVPRVRGDALQLQVGGRQQRLIGQRLLPLHERREERRGEEER